MATGILGIDCATIVGNSGIGTCTYNPTNIEGLLLVPAGTVWTPTNVATIQTVLNTGIANNTPTLRFYPIKRFTDMEDKSEDAIENTSGFGVKQFVRLGRYAYRFTYTNGGLDLHSNLSLFNNQADNWDVWLLDKVNNCMWGTASGTSNVKGFALDTLYCPNIKLNTGSKLTEYMIEIGLQDESELNKNFRLIKLNNSIPVLDTFSGLRGTRLEVVTELVASTKVIVLRVWAGSLNLYDTYTTELATTALFDAIKDSTGVQNVTASVVAAPASKAWTVTLTSTVTAGDTYTIKLGTVSDLVSAGITGYANCETTTTAT